MLKKRLFCHSLSTLHVDILTLHVQVNRFIESKSLIYVNQFGFRRKQSTIDAIAEVTERVGPKKKIKPISSFSKSKRSVRYPGSLGFIQKARNVRNVGGNCL